MPKSNPPRVPFPDVHLLVDEGVPDAYVANMGLVNNEYDRERIQHKLLETIRAEELAREPGVPVFTPRILGAVIASEAAVVEFQHVEGVEPLVDH